MHGLSLKTTLLYVIAMSLVCTPPLCPVAVGKKKSHRNETKSETAQWAKIPIFGSFLSKNFPEILYLQAMIFGNFFYADLCRRTCILPEVSYINRFLIGCVKTSPSSKICKAFFKTISLHFAPCSNKIPTQSKLRAAAGH